MNSPKVRITAALAAAVTVSGTILASVVADQVSGGINSAKERVTRDQSDFPGEFEVSYGSLNDPGAIFTNSSPASLRGNLEYEAKLDWIRAQGGVLTSSTVIFMHVGPTSGGRVLIRDVEVRRTSCANALTGRNLQYGGAGDVFGKYLEVDLDSGTGEPVAAKLTGDTVPKWRFPLWVDTAESEELPIILDSAAGHYTVEVDVFLSVDGKDAKITLTHDDEGVPFEVTGVANATARQVYTHDGTPVDSELLSVERNTPAKC